MHKIRTQNLCNLYLDKKSRGLDGPPFYHINNNLSREKIQKKYTKSISEFCVFCLLTI